MPIPSNITDLSTAPASNSPSGSESATEGDNHLRTVYSFLRRVYDGETAAADSTDVAKGDALVAVKRSDTGAVSTTQHEMNGRYIDLFDFMSSSDKAAYIAQTSPPDITAALNNALAASVSGLGKRVYMPTGKGRITSAIAWPVDWPVELRGEGIDATIIEVSGAINGFNLVGTSGNNVLKSCVRDMRITGASGALIAINSEWNTYFQLKNVRINGFVQGVKHNIGWFHLYEHVSIDNCSSHAFQLLSEANNIALVNCELFLCGGAGLYCKGSRSVSLYGCALEGNDFGAYVTSDATSTTHSTLFSGCYIEGNTSDEIRVTKEAGSAPINTVVDTCYFVRLTGKATQAVRAINADGLSVDKCQFYAGTATYTNSLYLSDSADVSGVVWGRKNKDATTSGVYRGTGTSYTDEVTQLARAWGRFTVSGGAITFSNLVGVSSVTRISVGVYEVTLRDAMPSTGYGVNATAEDGASYVAILCSAMPPASTTVFRINTAAPGGTAADARNVSFSVFAQ